MSGQKHALPWKEWRVQAPKMYDKIKELLKKFNQYYSCNLTLSEVSDDLLDYLVDIYFENAEMLADRARWTAAQEAAIRRHFFRHGRHPNGSFAFMKNLPTYEAQDASLMMISPVRKMEPTTISSIPSTMQYIQYNNPAVPSSAPAPPAMALFGSSHSRGDGRHQAMATGNTIPKQRLATVTTRSTTAKQRTATVTQSTDPVVKPGLTVATSTSTAYAGASSSTGSGSPTKVTRAPKGKKKVKKSLNFGQSTSLPSSVSAPATPVTQQLLSQSTGDDPLSGVQRYTLRARRAGTAAQSAAAAGIHPRLVFQGPSSGHVTPAPKRSQAPFGDAGQATAKRTRQDDSPSPKGQKGKKNTSDDKGRIY